MWRYDPPVGRTPAQEGRQAACGQQQKKRARRRRAEEKVLRPPGAGRGAYPGSCQACFEDYGKGDHEGERRLAHPRCVCGMSCTLDAAHDAHPLSRCADRNTGRPRREKQPLTSLEFAVFPLGHAPAMPCTGPRCACPEGRSLPPAPSLSVGRRVVGRVASTPASRCAPPSGSGRHRAPRWGVDSTVVCIRCAVESTRWPPSDGGVRYSARNSSRRAHKYAFARPFPVVGVRGA
jgi:hypothetical protein